MIGGPPSPPGGQLFQTYGDPEQKSGIWKNAAMGLAGPLMALLGSKASGGAMSFTDGLAHFGRGFADASYQRVNENYRRSQNQEQYYRDIVHNDILPKMKELDQDSINEFPELSSAMQKYVDSMADGKGLSGKEAQGIIAMWSGARYAQALRATKRRQEDQDLVGDAEARQRAQERIFGQNIGTATARGRFDAEGREQAGPFFEGGQATQDQGVSPREQFAAGEVRSRIASTPQYHDEYGLVTGAQRTALDRAQMARRNRADALKIAEQRLGISREHLQLSKDRFAFQKAQAVRAKLYDLMYNPAKSYLLGDVESMTPEELGNLAAQAVGEIYEDAPDPGAPALPAAPGGNGPTVIPWQQYFQQN